MQKFQKQTPGPGFGIEDVLYILFKHKWKIIILSILGFIASGIVFSKRKILFQTQAKILVSYVLNEDSVNQFQSSTNPSGGPGDQVINTEIEILTSENLALDVANVVGIEKIIPNSNRGTKLVDAAGTLLGNLVVAATPGSKVIHLSYSNPDSEAAKLVLGELVNQYKINHLKIHQSGAAYDDVAKQTEDVRLRLKQTESELDLLRTKSGITTLAEATGALANQRAKTREDLMRAKAELAEEKARVANLEKSMTNLNESEVGSTQANIQKEDSLTKKAPLQILSEYKAQLEVLSVLQKRDLELRLKFRSGNRLVALNQEQIRDADTKRKALVEKYPELGNETVLYAEEADSSRLDLSSLRANLASIIARVTAYESHLIEIDDEFKEQYVIGSQIDVLERRRSMEDAEYRSLETNLKNSKLINILDPSRMPNLKVIQNPSNPIVTYDKITQKIVIGLAGAGMVLGLGFAFIIELFFDRRIKRSTEIQARLQLPLLLSIPYIRRKDRGGLLLSTELAAKRIGSPVGISAIVEHNGMAEQSNRRVSHFILPYAETIRDKIIFNFEINNVIHKPKLVAVAGLSQGAGSSTIAAGLAKSFSEINGAKVLLVDLSSIRPEDNPMFGEVPRYSLTGALQLAKSSKFKQSDQNLYYASATARRDDRGLTTFSPMHLYEMMPNLQTSDYDYIVFDMPPIDQTSRTLTMAGLMDKILLVLDAENTSRDALKWGYSELVKGKADVSCIFNKTKSHAPGWLIGEN